MLLGTLAASVFCFAAVCSAKSGVFRMCFTNDLEAVIFGVPVSLMYSGSAADVRICGQKDLW